MTAINRIVSAEGAPWADAQALRNDTPPSSVAAARDFWLGASVGGTHTLSYALCNPQGQSCLATNLAIESIVARFATNLYYAAYGETNGILVNLSSTNYDAADFTLKLDGTVCATGQPPWRLAVGNLAAGAHTLRVQSKTFPDLADVATVYVIKVSLVPDYDRDGVIGTLDKTHASTNELFRWWVNDDADAEGDFTGASGVPGQTPGNHADLAVNGRGDLIDFFPVHLDLHDALETLSGVEGVQYRLRHDGGALKAVYTGLSADQAGAFLTCSNSLFGPAFNQSAHAAPVFAVTPEGVTLPFGFLSLIGDHPAKGVLLIEGTAATTAPLFIEVWKDNQKIVETPLALSVSGVEAMFRRHNFRIEAALPEMLSDPPNRPDAGCRNMDVFMAHGFRVEEDESRAWGSEFFKRLFTNSAAFSGDDRVTLNWRGRFAAAPVLYNFWSSGDEVLEIAAYGTDIDLTSGIEWDWELDWWPVTPNARRFVWHKQALFKGRSMFYGTTWAGWGFWEWWLGGRVYSVEQANALTDDQLRAEPVFRHNPDEMFVSNIVVVVRNNILAQGIPELSYPIGYTNVTSAYCVENIDLNSDANMRRDDEAWPQRDVDFSDDGQRPNRWLHTDLMNLPHFYTHKLYQRLVEEGDMK